MPESNKILQSRSEFLGSDSEVIMNSLNNLHITSLALPSPSPYLNDFVLKSNKRKDKYLHKLSKSKNQLKIENISKYNLLRATNPNILNLSFTKSNTTDSNDLSLPIRRQIFER